MIAFLIKRKIAVIMSFVACICLGLISLNGIPISLLPHLDIPRIEIKFEQPNLDSKELKNTVIKPVVRELGLINNLKQIHAETKNGEATIYMELIEGTNINVTYLEITERLEKLLSNFPRNIERPKIIKYTPSEIPVFFINSSYPSKSNSQNLQYSNFIKSVCIKKLESLKEVSYVDVTGYLSKRIIIEVEDYKLKSYNIPYSLIEDLIQKNNVIGKSFEIRDKSYLYTLNLNESLSTIEEIKNLPIKIKDEYISIKDIAKVHEEIVADKGVFAQEGGTGISMAIIKNEKSKVNDLKENLLKALSEIQDEYPEFNFKISQDQTGILENSINNLFQSLFLGLLLAGILVYLFIKNLKLSFIISIVIPASVIISFLFIKILGISINIISLSGLIIGVGLMIDNSIIMIDNISQYRNNGFSLTDACIKGTTDVVKPLLTSLLTTCIIFIPLIFLDGIVGVLFYDQAMSLIIGLFVSYLITIIILPTFYKLVNINKTDYSNNILHSVYNYISEMSFTKRRLTLLLFFLLTTASLTLANFINVEKFPKVSYNEFYLELDWGTNLPKNKSVVNSKQLYSELTNIEGISSVSYYHGVQKFLSPSLIHQFNKGKTRYILKVKTPEVVESVEDKIVSLLQGKYPSYGYTIKPLENLFDKVFQSKLPNLSLKEYESEKVNSTISQLKTKFSTVKVSLPTKEQVFQLHINNDQLMNYGISKEHLLNQLRFLFGKTKIDDLKNEGKVLPIFIKQKHNQLYDILNQNSIYSESKESISLSSIISLSKFEKDKIHYTDIRGDYIPLNIQSVRENHIIEYFNNKLFNQTNSLEGKYFEDRKFISDFSYIIVVELILLYFILAVQFNSLLLPVIILVELPISIAGSVLALFVFGYSLNVMSGIGIIVSLGIVINDSIIKIDSMNKIKQDSSLDIIRVVKIAGKKRFNSIVMTSLTTILATIPLLFYTDLGSNIQKPLAISLIGSLSIGTLASLFLIPLLYQKIYNLSQPKLESN